jgi:predicted translin family RNA/ssDNA-binding protein
MAESGDDLYDDATRKSVLSRIATVQEEAISLKGLVFRDCESWVAAHGVDVDAAQNQAERAMHKLKGVRQLHQAASPCPGSQFSP